MVATREPLVEAPERAGRGEAPASRPARRAVLVGAAGAAVLAVVAAVDPGSAILPACPFHAVTGLWCPGCGMTRGLRALVHGDVAGAVAANLFLPVVVLVALWGWWSVLARAVGDGPPARRFPEQAWVVLAIAAGVFGILRNLPGLEALAP